MASRVLHPRHRLDLRAADVAYGLGAVLLARDARAQRHRVLTRAEAVPDGLVASSVRSAWDLLLQTCGWAPGAEVVVSAVTHPAMAALVAEHGFVAVPVDLDLATLLPTPEAVAAVLTPRTRAVLVAQLFGGRGDLSALADLCRRRRLLLVEDAAQAWRGPATLRSPADVTFVSFGLIKTATALGGALVRVGDAGLNARLEAVHDTWPVAARTVLLRRLLRASVLLVLGRPAAYGRARRAVARLGVDPDALLDRATRSAADPCARRRRPGAAQLAFLAHRLRPQDPGVRRTRERAAAGERLRSALPAGLPGADTRRTHWLFPVPVADPAVLVARLRAGGVDASPGTSNLVALTTEGAAADLMRRVVYVPAYPELPAAARAVVLDALVVGAAG